MYEIKNRIFLELSKNQKSALCNFLRAMTKKNYELNVEDILDKFLEDEKYYLEINSSRFEFLNDMIDSDKFISDAGIFIKECKKYYDYQKSRVPMIQAQKEFDKKKRKFLQEVKMSKELPTQKQISYYNSLCIRYNLDKKNLENLSKLDMRNMIDEILDEYKAD